ncbi:N-acetyltransferase ats1 [Verticillium alfalfae VaMs.102]|uniref:N-acetyltransferase ats1 n=1 Tax=Verticillium alfalfae (strain VaMs.102 / ATCC MYA-4576 / FGSC 10136) TaxID=526221 RepID=C9SEL5_VERA1|nr:N-acetyltransferase ats1 [Verticillium alfalfae VaMs.102]EEY16608.1 N-acetyltransferase ats1 [Verticillium alfalfae VaMs.102]
MATQCSYRFATREDVPTIYSFLREGSSEQDPESKPKLTETKLLDTLSFIESSKDVRREPSFTPGFAKTLLLISPEGDIAGMAIFFYNYSTWSAEPGICLEELFVSKRYRRRGYAGLLIKRLVTEAQELGGTKLEWNCYRSNEPALKFYDSLGAKRMEHWVTLRLDEEAMEQLAQAEET